MPHTTPSPLPLSPPTFILIAQDTITVHVTETYAMQYAPGDMVSGRGYGGAPTQHFAHAAKHKTLAAAQATWTDLCTRYALGTTGEDAMSVAEVHNVVVQIFPV